MLSERGAAGVLAGAVTACVAYAALRLVDGQTEGVILLSARVPYYWRAAAALVVAVVVGLLAGLGLRAGEAGRLLSARWWLALIAGAAGVVVLYP